MSDLGDALHSESRSFDPAALAHARRLYRFLMQAWIPAIGLTAEQAQDVWRCEAGANWWGGPRGKIRRAA